MKTMDRKATTDDGPSVGRDSKRFEIKNRSVASYQQRDKSE
ncbi:hypothetical protein B4113_4172 [Geobacillus sp. B4113_201601]|nr:hypothetical protein B4113_4172 [Geobacillus sp. B4113_201601]